MNSLSRKNERKHQLKGILYTGLLLCLLAGMLVFSGQAEGLKQKVMQLLSPEQEQLAPDNHAPVALLRLDHRGGNG